LLWVSRNRVRPRCRWNSAIAAGADHVVAQHREQDRAAALQDFRFRIRQHAVVDLFDIEVFPQPGFVEPVEVISQRRFERHDAQRVPSLCRRARDDGRRQRRRQHAFESGQRMQQVHALLAAVLREQIVDRTPQRLGRTQFGIRPCGQRQPAAAFVGGVDHDLQPTLIRQPVGQLAHRRMGLADAFGDVADGLRAAVVEHAQQRQPAPLQAKTRDPVNLVGEGVQAVADGAHAAAKGDESELGDVFHIDRSLIT
jgi:hypothetical protein